MTIETIETVLNVKGSEVISVSPNTILSDVIAMLTAKNIGAMLVIDEKETMLGVVSERDIIREISRKGPNILKKSVRKVMTKKVVAVRPGATLESTMASMTDRRIRHMPVVANQKLVGIISLSDVVKARIVQLEHETTVMREFIMVSG